MQLWFSQGRKFLVAGSFIISLTLLACQPQASPPAATPVTSVGDASKGRELYVSKGCVACHGDKAEGNIGPKTAGTSLSFEEMKTQIRNPRDQMPPFNAALVSDGELADIYSYLKSLGSS